MADQSVRITNLPDSGSPERVALDMANLIRGRQSVDAYNTREGFLDLYAECLAATRSYAGYKPSR